jgi:molybdopterin synthase sulfur carrier subunit
MKIQYFAWLREQLNRSQDEVEPPKFVETVADLVAWLRTRDAGAASALANPKTFRVALDSKLAGLDASVVGASIVAFFPPMTGG